MRSVEIARSPLPDDVEQSHPGKWIAVRDGKVVAEADDLEALVSSPSFEPDDAVYHVPPPGSHCY